MPYTKAITIIFSVLVIGTSSNISANAINITNTHSSTSALLAFDTPAKKSVHSQQLEAGETPKGISKPEWQSIQTQMSLGKYKAYQQEDGSYHSSNPNNGWRIAYAVDGTTTVSPYDKNSTENYHIAFRLDSVSYDAAENSGQNSLEKPVAISFENNRLNYQWNNNITEYWINSEEKLEQWFEIKQRPQRKQAGDQQGPLQLQMILDTNLKASLQNNSLSLSDPSKLSNTISYNKLKVWDATGKIMLAKMQLQDKLLTLLVDDKTAVYPLTIDPSLAQQAYLKASNTDAGDYFGYSVSISGDTLVIGALLEDSSATGVNGDQSNGEAPRSGAAYVFTRSGASWIQQAYLKASNTDNGDTFGASVSISGNTLVIGAFEEGSNATGVNGDQADNSFRTRGSGAAYVFVRNGTNWSQQAYLKASNTDGFDRFGASVSISGNTLVIGARDEDSGATGVNGDQSNDFVSGKSSGAVYVFVRDGISWSQQAYLKASNTDGFDRFGASVSISGNTLVIGARDEDSGATGVNGDQADNSARDSGAAYVFVRDGSNWNQQAYLKSSNAEAGDNFGGSASTSGDTLVIGAVGEDSIATGVNGNQSNGSVRSGAAYVFVRNGTNWSQQAYLKASNTGLLDLFGAPVSISGDVLVVGASRESSNATGVNGDQTDNSARFSGAAYVFARNGTSWSQQAYLKASNTSPLDEFGTSVSVSGDTLVIGVAREDSNAVGVNGDQADDSADNAGAAYVFNIPTISLGGDISGLVGSVSLQNNGADDITLNMDGPFAFSAQHDGSTYEVTISSQPATQICTVANGSGTLAGININNVLVICNTVESIFTNDFEAPEN